MLRLSLLFTITFHFLRTLFTTLIFDRTLLITLILDERYMGCSIKIENLKECRCEKLVSDFKLQPDKGMCWIED